MNERPRSKGFSDDANAAAADDAKCGQSGKQAQAPEKLADDIAIGADSVADYIFGDRKFKRRVYSLRRARRIAEATGSGAEDHREAQAIAEQPTGTGAAARKHGEKK